MSLLTVASFNEMDPAETLKDRLEQAGIHAEIYDESKVQRYWFMSQPSAWVKLRVDPKDFDSTRRLLDGLDVIEGALSEAVRCPQCQSSRIEYPQFTRKFITPTLMELFCAVKLLDKEYYCEDCHYTWPKVEKLKPETDILGWPREKEQKKAINEDLHSGSE
jgi:hypothetical protein